MKQVSSKQHTDLRNYENTVKPYQGLPKDELSQQAIKNNEKGHIQVQ